MDLSIRADESIFPGFGAEDRGLAHNPHGFYQQQVQLLYFDLDDFLAFLDRDGFMIGIGGLLPAWRWL
jgi:hypothetical protein